MIVKDVLFHLDDGQIEAALHNLRESSWRNLLLTSTDNASNDDRAFDRWHYAPVNFLLPPYSFEPAACSNGQTAAGSSCWRRTD